ncbi:hypothetical protein I4U23_014315 [Adineta vaga]|nr:hypothetical protein I4U23_014315 [Adineta vaga]
MKSTIYFIIFMFLIISSVQSRSLYDTESDIRLIRSYFVESPSYPDLLALFTNSKKSTYKKNSDNHIMAHQPGQHKIEKQGFQTHPTQPFHRRTRISSLYGRKSHWDTFFG